MADLPAALIIGALCGILGAIFVDVNTRMGILRKKYINTNCRKIFEVCFFSFLTAVAFFFVAMSSDNCQKKVDDVREYYAFQCPEGYYSPLATLLLNTEGGTIRSVVDYELKLSHYDSVMFTLVWYVFFITTYGCWVPSGLFLPGIIIGCGLGQIYGLLFEDVFPHGTPMTDQSYKIMGATAMLGGYTRLTYSLCVIMLETTQSINFFIPIVIAVIIAVEVGDLFNRSLYERALRAKQIPLLRNNCPKSQRDITAFQIMSPYVVTVEGIIAVDHLAKILQKPYSSFPVVNSSGNIIGIIPKNFIIKLIELHHWVEPGSLDAHQRARLPKVFKRSTSGLDGMGMTNSLGAADDDWFAGADMSDGEQDEKGKSDSHWTAPRQEPAALDVVEQDPLKKAEQENNQLVQSADDGFDHHRTEMEAVKSLTAESRAGFNSEASPGLKLARSKTSGGLGSGGKGTDLVARRRQTLRQFTGVSDLAEFPMTSDELEYWHFNSDFYSKDRTYDEVADICDANRDKMVDVRPYMIETPFLAQSTDRLQKILDIYRHMHLRVLAVTNPGTGALEGIITRQDLFQYMSL